MAGSHHPTLALGEVTQSRQRQGCSGSVSQPLPFSQLGRGGLLNAPLKKKQNYGAIYTTTHLALALSPWGGCSLLYFPSFHIKPAVPGWLGV